MMDEQEIKNNWGENASLVQPENDFMAGLQGYTPEKVKEGFDVIKGTFNCKFNIFRIEPYAGDIEELKGTEIARYELTIINDGEYFGRKFFKRFYLGSQKVNGKGKTDTMKMADALYTMGYAFKSKEELLAVLERAAEDVVEVKAYAWTPEGKEALQMHIIKGQGNSVKEEITTKVPF